MSQFITMIIFLAGVQTEAEHAAFGQPKKSGSPLFVYWYGWSFYVLIASYLLANIAAVIGIDINIRWYKQGRTGRLRGQREDLEGRLILCDETVLYERYEMYVCTV